MEARSRAGVDSVRARSIEGKRDLSPLWKS